MIIINWVNCIECARLFPTNADMSTDKVCSKCEWQLQKGCRDTRLSVPMQVREAWLSTGPQGAD